MLRSKKQTKTRDAIVITRSPAQKPACKDLSRNGQGWAIMPEATYTPVSNRTGSRSTITRSPAQGSACKDLGRNGLRRGHHAQGRLHSDS
ncbi:hypothetical protein F9B82_06085 [Lacticaseibacillus casei]|nr:hypothetical protein F9B82_06085 [Lacticaseibacillus casei]